VPAQPRVRDLRIRSVELGSSLQSFASVEVAFNVLSLNC
jgi:hypothetical protein